MTDDSITAAGPVRDWRHDGASVLIRHEQGVLQLQAVAADIVRVRFAPSGHFAARRDWAVSAALPGAALSLGEHPDRLWFATAAIHVELDRRSGALAFRRPGGDTFAADLAPPGWRDMSLSDTALQNYPDTELPAGNARCGVFLHKRLASDEGLFGFGQRTGRLDRRHRRLTHWTIDRASPGHSRGHDNLYQAHPVLMALRPGLCWGLFMDSTWYSAFDAGAAEPDTLTLFTLGGELDYYLFAGPTPAAVVEQLTRLTGRPALPPLWALGYHQSRWSYRSDAEVREIAAQFRARRIPLDAIHIDIDHMRGFRVFTWDPERFPDPAATIAALHAAAVHAVVIIDPGVKAETGSGYAVADGGIAGDHFVRRPDGSLFEGHVWPGESLFPDFCRSDTRRWWGDWHAGLLEAGVDGIWCDMNEPSIVDRPFSEPGVHDQPIPLDARHGDHGEALQAETHNLYGTLMARATAEGIARLRPGSRPWVLTRSGFVGVQRWAASWMGDNSSWWEHLEMSLPQLASMGLSGSPHVGVDIGGFYHNCFGELFARWIELGSFYPFMRCHTHQQSRAQEPWSFGPQVEEVARRAIGLRYRLLPYLYTLAHRTHRSGEPMLRPLLFDFPNDPGLWQIEDQVMIGPQLMIAPVCRPGIRRRLVELPPGLWYELHSGLPTGDGPLIAEMPPGRMPVYVRGGSILTLGNLRQSSRETLKELTLEVFPDPARSANWTLLEDDGRTTAYRDGTLAETDYRVSQTADGCELIIAARRGAYRPAPRELIVRLHLAAAPRRVVLDGRETQQGQWCASDHSLQLHWADDGCAHHVRCD